MTEQSGPKRRRWLNIAIFAAPVLIASVIAWKIWFYDYGIGEYIDSPNGQYTARINHWYQRTLWEGEIEFVRARVIDKSTERVLWSFEYHPSNTSILWDYEDRSRTFIQWNATSDEVVFPLDKTGKQIAVPMP